jgi:PAS domain S-box-containing protein
MNFKRLLRSKSIPWAFAVGLLIAGLYMALHARRLDSRVYRIGWQFAPPFQEKAADGSPAGLAIELVRDAAQRRGIKLEWIWWPGSSEDALRSRQVDLWPLITVTPERQRIIHISTPYLQHDYDLLVSATNPHSRLQDFASASISCTRLAIDRQFLERMLPGARLVPVGGAEYAIQDVCAGRTEAAFLDEFSAGAALFSGLCSHAMRAVPVPGLRTKLGVGSTREATAAADEIRRGIDDSVRQGDLAMILQSGGYFSSRNMQYFTAILESQQRQKWLSVTVGIFACLLCFTVLAADRIRRQRNRIKTADDALRQSERRFRELLEDANLVAVMTDSSGAIDFWNGYARAITGWSKEEVIGRPAREFLDPAPLAPADDTGGRPALEAQQSFVEGSILQKSGEPRWIQWSRTPLRDSAGRTIGYASLGEDVTELRALRAEAARRES